MTVRPRDTEPINLEGPISAKTRNVLWFRVLRWLDKGAAAVSAGDETYRVGGLTVSPAIITELARHDLVKPVAGASGDDVSTAGFPDAYVISQPGRAFLRRAEAKRRQGDLKSVERTGLRPRGASGVRKRNHAGRSTDSVAGAYRAQHQILETQVKPETGPTLVNRAENPLGWLRQRKGRDGKPFLSEAQFAAGEALRKDFEIAGMMPQLTTDLSGRPAGDKYAVPRERMTATERQIAAKQRFDRALAAVGPGLDDVLLRVCCFLDGIEAAERSLGWPTRSGKLVLAIALDRLVRHYGLA